MVLTKQRVVTGIASVLMIAALTGVYLTRDVEQRKPAPRQGLTFVVDERLYVTANQVAASTESVDERELAREALRLTDHELDQAYASALREAASARPPSNGPLKALADRIAAAELRLDVARAKIAEWKRIVDAGKAGADAASAKIQLAEAQLSLDEDELEDAREELTRKGGDRRGEMERAAKLRESLHASVLEPGKAVAPASAPFTAAAQIELLLNLRAREERLDAARQQAASRAQALTREHDALQNLIGSNPLAARKILDAAADEGADDSETSVEDPADSVARLKSLSDQRKTLAELGRRIQDTTQLADVYRRWTVLIDARQTAAWHLVLVSCAVLLSIVLASLAVTWLLGRIVNGASERVKGDRRRVHQLRGVAAVGVQALAVLAMLVVIFGPPSQVSTLIGFATAGLTVAMRDFIVAFFGWFMLLGRNGVHIGDWIEIDGIGGEVIELSIMHTVLLERGEGNHTGRPTGRRVSFVNSYAIEKRWFNFSTAGQWLWDVFEVTLPARADAYAMAESIRQIAEEETRGDAEQAELDWERATQSYGLRPFSARPNVDLRPSGAGLEVQIRYITRASERFAVKSKLLESIIRLLQADATVTPARG